MRGRDTTESVSLQHLHLLVVFNCDRALVQLSSSLLGLGSVSRKSREDGSVEDECDSVGDETEHVQSHSAFPLRGFGDAQETKLRSPTYDCLLARA